MSELEKNLYKRVEVKNANAPKPSTGRAYRGFSTTDINRESFSLYDFELIKQDIINHFHIRQGEKISDPDFGTIIWDVLFDPLTEDLKQAITANVTEIINYDPRVQATNIFVDSYEHGIIVEATLLFLPYNIADQIRFKFDQAAIDV